jgi:beta-lactam-binding protein with PASTA domain/ABC-type amino acid transport substrate-binding protein
MAALLAMLLVLTGSMATVAQSPAPTTDGSSASGAILGGPTLGGILAEEEGRDATSPAIALGTSLDGTKVNGFRSAFRPDESFAFRLELPEAVGAVALTVQLAGTQNGVDALWSYPALPADPSWDTIAGTLPAPPVGDYTLRVFKGTDLLAETPLSVADVPRLTALLTDPLGLVSNDLQRVSDAGKRYEDATGGGWLWNVLIDTTNGIPVSEWAADLWAVNADQIDPRDAMLVAAAGDIDLSIVVGADAGRTILPDEISEIEDEAVFALGDGRFADMIDGVADGLVIAHEEGPEASPTPEPTEEPTPEPSATPETVRVPNLVGMTRDEAELLAARRGLEVSVTTRRTTEAVRGTVIEQDPPAGRSVARGETVAIVVAAAPQTVEIPDVTGLSEDDAVGVLLDAGFEIGTRTRRYSETINEGDVIRTDPRAGTDAARGSTVDYIVSRGPNPNPTPTPTPTPAPTATPKPVPQVAVPQVRNMSQDDAIAELLDKKFKIGEIREVTHPSIPAGNVTKTNPTAGTKVDRGSSVVLFVSTGPAAGLETPAPTETPGPVESLPATGDRLARIQDAGVIRVNIADDDIPWSFINANGRRNGFDAAVARSLAERLGVELELTTFPLDEVRAGLWDDRFDVAISRLPVAQSDPQLLEFSDPYAYDPQQLSVTAESGLTSVDELADRAICVAAGDTGAAWLAGSLSLVDAPLEPAAPPSGATAYDGPSNPDCVALVAAGGAPFDGWLASLPTIDRAVGGGATVTTVGDPVVWAPVAVAFDAKAGDNASLIEAVNEILAGLSDDGTLVKASIRATGYDLTTVPADGVPVPLTPLSESPAA